MAKEFYLEMASTLNLLHGKVLKATTLQSTKENLQDALNGNFGNKRCQQDSCIDTIQAILRNFGIFCSAELVMFSEYFLAAQESSICYLVTH